MSSAEDLNNKISIIIPVLNEADNLEELLPFFQKIGEAFEFELIIVDGGSKDNSQHLVSSNGFRFLHSPRCGRAFQMNHGAAAAKGEILYFVHADTRIPTFFHEDIFDALEDNYDAGCYAYAFDSPSRLLKINSWFTKFDGVLSGGGDQTLFIKKAVFEQLGGFNEYYCIMEDFDIVRRIRKKYRFKVIPKQILVSARKYETNSWLRVQLVNLLVFGLFFLKIHPLKLKNIYSKLLNYR
ncbi:TIGR04283 family arsenosugar biosynthesis glycosyltransferase [Mongoliibacter ruber]|uniref:RSAM/selenodomain-associated transferase 2 n=1 Tax=Mongoliibacter ruber TaxID=1750599 RepID=A0A2T0WKJ9_9BACT|nr:TIGR04283 family arsenosugar biosynthesis glycosyltransferase [Mongoliibacter ruber]PRY87205.1 rSAM/selenodomain-associated transferase 2 [Mongoliibacter ruber]